MVAYEVMLELAADKFPNSGRRARARVLRELPDGPYLCEVDETIKGIQKPDGDYASLEEAKDAILVFWEHCSKSLADSYPNWMTIPR